MTCAFTHRELVITFLTLGNNDIQEDYINCIAVNTRIPSDLDGDIITFTKSKNGIKPRTIQNHFILSSKLDDTPDFEYISDLFKNWQEIGLIKDWQDDKQYMFMDGHSERDLTITEIDNWNMLLSSLIMSGLYSRCNTIDNLYMLDYNK